jgi:uncharacterized membrane protein YraQ (UPF0718 family)/copper chaperone CopZ
MSELTHYILQYLTALWQLTVEMAPYLLLGFFIAGLLYVYFPKERITRYLGKSNLASVFNAAMVGIPLPLCSCGVIPTGISLYKHGASKGSSVSFLISTPQTGVDSIMATYALLGLPFAIIRPIIALVTGIAGGLATNMGAKDTHTAAVENAEPASPAALKGHKLSRMLHYAFVEFLQDIAKWLIIGLLIAALIAVLVPANFFSAYVDNDLLSMLIVLVASVPLYVCATGSVPIAAVLLMKGLSPGAAIVFLMAGPATNAATMAVVGNVLGKRTLYTYLASIILGAIFFGLIVDHLLPRAWFTEMVPMVHEGHEHHFLPQWLNVGSGILLIVLLINSYIQRYRKHRQFIAQPEKADGLSTLDDTAMEKTVVVHGMTCNHCKMNVENNLKTVEGVKTIDVDLDTARVRLTGEHIDLDEVKKTVEGIGYEYAGEV